MQILPFEHRRIKNGRNVLQFCEWIYVEDINIIQLENLPAIRSRINPKIREGDSVWRLIYRGIRRTSL